MEKDAVPILFTSIVRRNFNQYGVLVDTHGAYPLVTRMVANEFQVPLIDLQYYTEVLEEGYGIEKSKNIHLHFDVGEHPYYPDGKIDNTHLSVEGATEIAKIVVDQIKKLNIPLSKNIR
jgi:lysophospholipase L1-like esterase